MNPSIKPWAIALAVSLTLNVFGLGFVAARQIRGHHWRANRAQATAQTSHGGRRAEFRTGGGPPAKVRQVILAHQTELAPRRGLVQSARESAKQALVTEPFDRARLLQSLTELRQASGALEEVRHQALVEAAAQMAAPERRSLAEWLGHERRLEGAKRD